MILLLKWMSMILHKEMNDNDIIKTYNKNNNKVIVILIVILMLINYIIFCSCCTYDRWSSVNIPVFSSAILAALAKNTLLFSGMLWIQIPAFRSLKKRLGCLGWRRLDSSLITTVYSLMPSSNNNYMMMMMIMMIMMMIMIIPTWPLMHNT